MEPDLTINPCVTRRQSVPFLTLSQVKLTVYITTTKEYIHQKNVYPLFWIMSRSPRLTHPSIPQLKRLTMLDLQFVVKNVLNQGWYIWIWNWRDKSHREHKKWRRNCLIYAGAHHRDEEFLAIFFYLKIFNDIKNRNTLLRRWLYAIVCIYCGVDGTRPILNKSVYHYPQCQICEENPTVLRKRKTTVEGDFKKKKKSVHPIDHRGKDNKKPSLIDAFSILNL